MAHNKLLGDNKLLCEVHHSCICAARMRVRLAFRDGQLDDKYSSVQNQMRLKTPKAAVYDNSGNTNTPSHEARVPPRIIERKQEAAVLSMCEL